MGVMIYCHHQQVMIVFNMLLKKKKSVRTLHRGAICIVMSIQLYTLPKHGSTLLLIILLFSPKLSLETKRFLKILAISADINRQLKYLLLKFIENKYNFQHTQICFLLRSTPSAMLNNREHRFKYKATIVAVASYCT